jgi:hypothetical protein
MVTILGHFIGIKRLERGVDHPRKSVALPLPTPLYLNDMLYGELL